MSCHRCAQLAQAGGGVVRPVLPAVVTQAETVAAAKAPAPAPSMIQGGDVAEKPAVRCLCLHGLCLVLQR